MQVLEQTPSQAHTAHTQSSKSSKSTKQLKVGVCVICVTVCVCVCVCVSVSLCVDIERAKLRPNCSRDFQTSQSWSFCGRHGMEMLPTEIIHEIAYKMLTTPTDILYLAMTCHTLYTKVLGVVGEENAYDVAQHRATAGVVYCCMREWWVAAEMAVERGYGDPTGSWQDRSWQDRRGRRETPMATAASSGVERLVGALLRHPEVDPGADANIALRRACANGQVEVVEMLLDDPRTDPTVRYNACLNLAVHSGDEQTVRVLLENDRVDPTLVGLTTLYTAIRSGSSGCLSMLLEDGRIDPRLKECALLRKASWTGNVEAVRLLLEDGRTTARGVKDAARTANRKGWTEIIDLLSTVVGEGEGEGEGVG